MLDGERWLEIEEFPNYMISNRGHVYGVHRREEKRVVRNQQGLLMVQLIRNRQTSMRSVALLVARAFVPEEDSRFNTPIHLDGNRENCDAENLAWRPRAFAIAYHRQFGSDDFYNPGSAVMDVETGERFNDTRDASVRYGLIRIHIFLAATNGTSVFPTGQEFVIINKRTKLAI